MAGAMDHTHGEVPLAYRVLKFPVTALLSITVTIALLYLMQFLIEGGEDAIKEVPSLKLVDFVRMKQSPELNVKRRQPDPPPVPDEPPPMMTATADAVDVENAWSSAFSPPVGEFQIEHTGTSFFSDGEYLPILKVQPQYPRRALERSWFGWVLVEFTVDESGRVINPIVIDNCVETFYKTETECVDRPGKVFDQPAIAAAEKFKYKPRVIDGQPSATEGVRHLITFRLDEMENL